MGNIQRRDRCSYPHPNLSSWRLRQLLVCQGRARRGPARSRGSGGRHPRPSPSRGCGRPGHDRHAAGRDGVVDAGRDASGPSGDAGKVPGRGRFSPTSSRRDSGTMSPGSSTSCPRARRHPARPAVLRAAGPITVPACPAPSPRGAPRIVIPSVHLPFVRSVSGIGPAVCESNRSQPRQSSN